MDVTFRIIASRVYNWGFLPAEKIDLYQHRIRDAEWGAVMPFIARNGKFLDVGCGTGYHLMRAKQELNCDVTGIDANPGQHGVGRFTGQFLQSFIMKGVAEQLPYANEMFDVIFSSHALEHVADPKQSLHEMNRVIKKNGVIILGIPTATMAWIGLISGVMFTTHRRWIDFFFRTSSNSNIKFLFLPPSHSKEGRTVLHDLKQYRIRRWSNLISSEFKIQQIILPALYCYPDFLQLFKIRKFRKLGSSVFFICSKYK